MQVPTTGDPNADKLLQFFVAKAGGMPEPHRQFYLAGHQFHYFTIAALKHFTGLDSEDIDDSLALLAADKWIRVHRYGYGYRLDVALNVRFDEGPKYP